MDNHDDYNYYISGKWYTTSFYREWIKKGFFHWFKVEEFSAVAIDALQTLAIQPKSNLSIVSA